MGSRDIRSTKERVNELNAIIRQIKTVINGCKSVQKQYDVNVRAGGNNYEDLHGAAKESMEELKTLLGLARDHLTDFIDNFGMTFQYTWEAGKNNIEKLDFETGRLASEGPFGGVSATVWTFDALSQTLIPTNGVVTVTGSTLNDGKHLVASCTPSAIYSASFAEEHDNLLAKVVYSMKEN